MGYDAATVLAYEARDANIFLRRPSKPKVDRLVKRRLILEAYGFTGILEMTTSFTMLYFYLQRSGIPFSDLWFQYGNMPGDLDPDYAATHLVEASSAYFIIRYAMVQSPRCANMTFKYLPTSATV